MGTPAPGSEATLGLAWSLAFDAASALSKTATPTVTAIPSRWYVTRISSRQPLFVSTVPRAPWAAEAQLSVAAVAPLAYFRPLAVIESPGKSVAALSGAVSFAGSERKSRGSGGGGGGGSEEKVGSGCSGVGGRLSDGGSDADGPSDALAPDPPSLTTAVATIAAMTAVATAPPPIISHRRRRARARSLSSASAAQSGVDGVDGPPGLQPGPPCPKLMGASYSLAVAADPRPESWTWDMWRRHTWSTTCPTEGCC